MFEGDHEIILASATLASNVITAVNMAAASANRCVHMKAALRLAFMKVASRFGLTLLGPF
jgi:hypothetical protein